MAGISFDVTARFEELVRLRTEIERTRAAIIALDQAASPNLFRDQERHLRDLTREYDRLFNALAPIIHQFRELERTGTNTFRDLAQVIAAGTQQVSAQSRAMGTLESHARSLGRTLGIALGINELKKFGSEIIRVRGEMQMLEQSFLVMLGSKAKSDAMLADIKDIALKSPLSLDDTANAAQMLLSFNISAEKVIPTLRQLGDISMGNRNKFNSLALAFSQMSAAGKLMGQELNQMINAGFNPLQVMAAKTGKSIAELKKEMSDGLISSEMVAEAFRSVTAEGGKFHNMMENQASGITGLQASLGDAWRTMLNNLGEQSEGVIQRGYKMTTALVENYETVGKVIVSLVATYGAYRAAVALNTVAESGWTIAQMAQYRVLLLVERAQRMLNAAMLTNPFVLAATAVVALAGAMWVLRDSTSASEKALAEYNKKREEAKRVEDEHKSRIESLINTVNDEAAATYQRIMAMKDLQKEYLDIFKDYDIEALKLADILKIKKQIAKVEGRKSLTSKEDEAAELRKQIETAKYEAKHDASRDRRLTSARRAARLERQLQLIEKDINAQKQAMWEANTPLSVKQEGLRGNIAALKEENKLLDEKISKQKEVNASGNLITFKDTSIDEARFEANKKSIAELEGLIKDATESTSQDAIEKNKAYWENVKKEAETALASMSTDKEGSEEWKRLKTQISEADEQLKKYNANAGKSTKRKSDESDEKQRIAAEKKVQDELLSMVRETQRARIELMDEGEKKELAKIEDTLENEIAELEKKIQGWRDAQEGSLTKEQTDAYDDAYKAIADKYIKAYGDFYTERDKLAADSMNEYLRTFGEHEEKILAINEHYNQKISESQTEGEKKILEAQRQRDIAETNADLIKKSKLWQKFFGDLEKLGKKSIRELIAQMEMLIQYGNGEITKLPDDLAESFGSLNDGTEQSQELLNGIVGQLERFRKIEREMKSAKMFDKIKEAFKELSEAGDDAKKKMVALQKILSGFSEVAGVFSELGTAMENAGMKAGKVVVQIGDIIATTLSMAGAGASVGGGWGAIIGAVVGLVSGLVSALSASGGMSEETRHYYESLVTVTDELIERQLELVRTSTGAAAQIAANNAQILNEERLMYEKKQWAADFANWSGSSHSNAKKLHDALADKRWVAQWLTGGVLGQTIGASDEGWAKSLGISIERFKELKEAGIDFDAWIEDINGAIGDLTPKQIELLMNTQEIWGMFDEKTQEYLKSVLNFGKTVEEIAAEVKKEFTGITFDELKGSLDSLITDFDLTFEEIGKSFEDHMSKAVLNLVKKKYLTEQLEAWYKQFSDAMSDDELSAEDAERLRQEYERIVRESNDEYKNAMKAAGIDISQTSGDENTLKGAYAKASQESIDLLAGQTGAQRVAVEKILSHLESGTYTITPEQIDAIIGNVRYAAESIAAGHTEVIAIRELTSKIAVISEQISANTSRIPEVADNTRDMMSSTKSIDDSCKEIGDIASGNNKIVETSDRMSKVITNAAGNNCLKVDLKEI